MSNSYKTAKLKKRVGAFIFSSVTFLLFVSNSFSTEIRWRKEYKAIIDGRVLDCAWAGGMELCKPTFVDIDADGDLDMFIGGEDGRISFFRNDGTKDQPQWSFISDFYDSIEVGEKIAPFFADIDDDGDFDLFVGSVEGMIVFYQNDGDSSFPLWLKITDSYDSIDVGEKSVPTFVDIDADLDFDLFIGEKVGNINFYQNDGTKKNPLWNLVTENYDSIDIGAGSAPHFVDIDSDGDFDLFIGEDYGNINFYRNVGTSDSAEWDLITSNYNSINVGRYSFPAFVDIDNDSDFDLFIGQKEGRIYFYRNDGNPWLPDWYFVTGNYNFMDLGGYTKPALADI
ncbi:MAG: VCBS repeat-containing protein, partial [candidate division Zixibacteria bacterium]|nr:VCBS repeat-containing protein [candidate division Zixibacteria bacterium]